MMSRQTGSGTNPFSRLLAQLKSGAATSRRFRKKSRSRNPAIPEALESRVLLSSVTVMTDVVQASDITLTATDDTPPDGDNLTISPGVTVESTGGFVTLNVGDNFFMSTNTVVRAFTDITVSLDSGAADPGDGGNVFLEGEFFSPSAVAINGGVDDDTFGLFPAAYLNTPLDIDAGGGSANILEFDLTGVTSPALTYTSPTSGVMSSTSHADVAFTNINQLLIFASSGTFSSVTLDLSTLQTGGDASADTIEVRSGGANSIQVMVNSVQLYDLNPSQFSELIINGSSDEETLTVNHAPGIVDMPVTFNGGVGADGLSVIGNGSTNANYTPDATVTGNGTVDVDTSTITFTGLEPVDISGMAAAEITLPGLNDLLTIENGFDFATGTVDAVRVSGTSGGVPIEAVAFFNNTTLTIDTSDLDGVDILTINSADNNHGNDGIAFRTGGTSADGDTILLNGNITTTNSHLFNNAAVTLNTDIVLTSTGGGNISFLDAPVDGVQSLTVNTSGVTNLSSAFGGTVALTSLTTDAPGATTIAEGNITTSGEQTYHDLVTLSVDTTLTGSSIILNNNLDASPSGFQGLDIVGDLVLGDGPGDNIGAVNPLGFLSVTGTTFIAATPAGPNTIRTSNTGATGDQTYSGPVLLSTGADVTLLAVGGGDISFDSTVNGGQSLTVNSSGITSFFDVVGGVTPLSSVTTDAGDSTFIGASVTTSGTQNYGDDAFVASGAILTGSTVTFSEDVMSGSGMVQQLAVAGNLVIGNAGDDVLHLDINGKTTAGVDYDQLLVAGTVTLQGGLSIDGTFTDTGTSGDTITLIDNDSTDPVVGTFDGMPNGTAVTLNGQTWRLLYDGGDGNDVVLAFGKARVSIGDASVVEGDSGTVVVTFDVTVDTASGGPFGVTYATADNTAGGSDYVSANSTLNFGGLTNGETQTVSITVNGDEVVELTETFLVTLTNILATTNVQFLDFSAVGTIQNDDAATLSIDDVTLAEGDAGTTLFTFTVTLDAAVDIGAGINFGTSDDTATTADSDYALASGTLNFSGNAGETETVTVFVNGDTTEELDESFFVTLSSLSVGGRSVTIAKPQGTGTIIDDDRIGVDLSVSAASGTESDVITLTATAAAPVSGNQTFTVSVAGVSASDYALSSSTITILNGETVGTVTFTIADDSLVEALETATVSLTNPSVGVRIGTVGSQDIAITDNDTATLTIADVTMAETDVGTTLFVFNVTSNAAIDTGFTVDFATDDMSATTANGDYTLNSGTLTFVGNSGEMHSLSVAVTGDAVVELDETFLVNLSNIVANGRSIVLGNSSATGTITNDDTASLSISNVTLLEGSSGTKLFSFIVTLDNTVDTGLSFTVNTADGTATFADDDYVPIIDDTVTLTGATGEMAMVNVTVNGDSEVEPNETFFVDLSGLLAGGRNVTLADSQGVGTITNDDVPTTVNLSVSTNDASEATPTVVTLTATSTNPVVGNQTVDVMVSGVTAGDYSLSAATITIPDGQTTGTVTFTVVDDAVVELTEAAVISIANPSAGMALGTTTSQSVSITDNDAATISIDDVSIAEGDSGGTFFTFTVTLSQAVDTGVTVHYATSNGSGTANSGDFAATSGDLLFAGTAGETQTFNVTVSGDQTVELDETFFVNLSVPAASGRMVTNADNQGRGTIVNDDAATLSINDRAVAEGDAGNTIVTFTVTLDNAVDIPFTVDYSTANGTATAGSDYTSVSGNTLAFAGSAGETQPIQILVSGDTVAEIDETFLVNLSNLPPTNRNISLADAQGVGTILDDDGIRVTLSADTNAGTEIDSTVVTLTATADSAVTG